MGQSIFHPAKTHAIIRSAYRLLGLRCSGVREIERRTGMLGAGKGAVEQVLNGDVQESENILEIASAVVGLHCHVH